MQGRRTMILLASLLALNLSGCGPNQQGNENPLLVVDQQVQSITFDTDSTASWVVDLRVTVSNDGNVDFTAVAITDSIVVAPTTFEIISGPTLTQGTLAVNGSWDGVTGSEPGLLDHADTLATATGAIIDMSLRFNGVLPPPVLTNIVYATGTTPLSTVVVVADTVAIILTPPPASPIVGLAKTITNLVSGGSSEYSALVTLYLESFTSITIDSVAIADSVESMIAPAILDSVGTVAVSTGATLTGNSSFDGTDANAQVILGAVSDSMTAGETAIVSFLIYFDSDGNTGTFFNQARVSATGPSGGLFEDWSDSGMNPDPSGDGFPNGTGEDDSTFFVLGGDTLCVSTSADIASALFNTPANDGKVIQIEAGIYSPASSNGWGINVRDATIIGAGLQGSVVLEQDQPGDVAIFQVHGRNNRIENLEFVGSQDQVIVDGSTQFGAGADSTTIYNCRFYDPLQHFVKGNYRASDTTGNFLEDLTVRNCWFQNRAGVADTSYSGGVDVHHANGTVVDSCTFIDIQSPGGGASEHAIHVWTNSESTTVEYNYIENCDRGIGVGFDVAGVNRGHDWAWIRGNNIIRTVDGNHPDVGIEASHAPNTFIDLNNVCISGYNYAIEVRWPESVATIDSCALVAGATGAARIRERDGGTAIIEATNTYPDSCGAPDDPPPPPPEGVLHVSDFTYLGAFRLPAGSGSPNQFTDCDGVQCYRSDGDPSGPNDGYPGSLYGVGHRQDSYAWEINIPTPADSGTAFSFLPQAAALTPPTKVVPGPPQIHTGILWLPAQGSQTSSKLYHTYWESYDYDNTPPDAKHFWTNVDFSNPTSKWVVGGLSSVDPLAVWFNCNDYYFEIPENWATANLNASLGVSGPAIACGRHRKGAGGSGPAIIAIAPWIDGNPPTGGSTIASKPLVQYDILECLQECIGDAPATGNCLGGVGSQAGVFGHTGDDAWQGGAWCETEKASAVLIVGSKGYGESWYGFADGHCCNECGGSCDGSCNTCGCQTSRGWFAERWAPTVLFYDPAVLALVAADTFDQSNVQPYETWDLSDIWYSKATPCCLTTNKPEISGCAYDRTNNLLYLTEKKALETSSHAYNAIHVFQIN